jgi:hypothetical protein
MIYYLEHDTAGNIHLVACNPLATIVPLINTATLLDAKGNEMKDAATGKPLSKWNLPVEEPVGIDQATFNLLMANKTDSYIYDVASGAVKERTPAPTAAPSTTPTTPASTTTTAVTNGK